MELRIVMPLKSHTSGELIITIQMKNTTLLILFIATLACNKNTKAQETKSSKVLWADNIQSVISLSRDTANWSNFSAAEPLPYNQKQIRSILTYTAFKYDKEKIFSSITHAVLSGKLKAYSDFPTAGKSLTIEEFNNILVQWDTTDTPSTALDTSNAKMLVVDVPIGAAIKIEITSNDITQLKFNETIEFDTLTYTINKKVSSITFYTEHVENGEWIDNDKEIFYVKLND